MPYCLKNIRIRFECAPLKDPTAIKVLADNVRRYRLERNLTQEALANTANIEYSQVSRIERCPINTSVSVIFALAKALEVEARQLLDQ